MEMCCMDPCVLFLCSDGELKNFVSLYVDNFLFAGSKEDIEELYVTF